jgi:hypothetical protein
MDKVKRVRKPFKAYKAFNKDLTCKDFQYEVGSTYQHKGQLSLCHSGFHASKICLEVFSYYRFDPRVTRVCEVLIRGRVIERDDKLCCSRIEILKELSWNEILEVCNIGVRNIGRGNIGVNNSGNYNSGNTNSGNYNTGARNSGVCNSGSRNSGNYNTGDRNSGDWNSGNRNSGTCNSGSWNSCRGDQNYLSTRSSGIIRVFNKPCEKYTWDTAEIPDFFYFSLTEWTEDDSRAGGGYLKTYDYKEAWSKAWANALEKDKRRLEKLPNFDWEVFTELTGIEKPENW